MPLGRSSGQVGLAVASGVDHAQIRARAPYDLIIANILAGPLIELAKQHWRAVLREHPAVADCAVVGVPSTEWGETPVAYVELKPGSSVTAADLVAHCKTLLAGYKVPREIRFEDIPKTSTGKIQKFQLRERAKSASAIE